MKRKGSAIWNGTGKEGTGVVSTQSTVLSNVQYSFNSRFEDGIGTNPEELIAAAHAGCYSMKLAFILNAAGFTAESIETSCTITLEGGVIKSSELSVVASIDGISEEQFQSAVKEAEETCPVSNALDMEISSTGQLAS